MVRWVGWIPESPPQTALYLSGSGVVDTFKNTCTEFLQDSVYSTNFFHRFVFDGVIKNAMWPYVLDTVYVPKM